MFRFQTDTITSMQKNYNLVLDKLSKGPVLLLQRSTMAAVMIDPEQFNAMTEELSRLRRIVAADKDFAAIAAGNYTDELP